MIKFTLPHSCCPGVSKLTSLGRVRQSHINSPAPILASIPKVPYGGIPYFTLARARKLILFPMLIRSSRYPGTTTTTFRSRGCMINAHWSTHPLLISYYCLNLTPGENGR